MRIVLLGPVTLSLLERHLGKRVESVGYPFPLLAVLADQFIEMGHHVTIISTASDINSIQCIEGPKLTLRLVPSRDRARDRALDLFAAERAGIGEAIRLSEYDVLHAHWTYEFAKAALDADRAKTLITIHDAPLTVLFHLPDAYRLLRCVLAVAVRMKASNLVAISPYLRSRWRREMLDFRTIRVIPNPVTAESVTRDASTQFAPSTGQSFSIVDIADASRRKNIRTLIKAFALLRERWPGASLRLIGPGLGRDGAVASWAEKRKLSVGVSFLGRLEHDEALAEIDRSTVLVHPSLEESHGIVLTEAILLGKPVVAHRGAGGTVWALLEGNAGLLVDARSHRSLMEGIINAVEGERPDGAIADEVAARHSASSVAERYIDKYTSVASRARLIDTSVKPR